MATFTFVRQFNSATDKFIRDIAGTMQLERNIHRPRISPAAEINLRRFAAQPCASANRYQAVGLSQFDKAFSFLWISRNALSASAPSSSNTAEAQFSSTLQSRGEVDNIRFTFSSERNDCRRSSRARLRDFTANIIQRFVVIKMQCQRHVAVVE